MHLHLRLQFNFLRHFFFSFFFSVFAWFRRCDKLPDSQFSFFIFLFCLLNRFPFFRSFCVWLWKEFILLFAHYLCIIICCSDSNSSVCIVFCDRFMFNVQPEMIFRPVYLELQIKIRANYNNCSKIDFLCDRCEGVIWSVIHTCIIMCRNLSTLSKWNAEQLSSIS